MVLKNSRPIIYTLAKSLVPECRFWFVCNPDKGDKLFMVDGFMVLPILSNRMLNNVGI